MNLRKLLSGVALAVLLSVGASAPHLAQAALNADQRGSDFAQLVNLIERHYAPLKWKKESIGLDFKRTVEEYRGKVQAARSDSEFYQLMARFLAELKDTHVSTMIPSTYAATLGFQVDLIGGKVLIETVDRLRLPEQLFPFKKGDQLLALDGVPVENLIKDLAKVTNLGNERSTMRLAAARLTGRREASGYAVPKGVVQITALRKGAAKPETVTAVWAVTGTPVVDMDDLAGLMEGGAIVNTLPTASSGDELLEQLKKLPEQNLAAPMALVDDMKKIGLSDIGSPKSMFKLPEGAKELPLGVTAAIYEAGGKKIGILRIPSYMDEGLAMVLARALSVMEQETDVLVLDQTNNPGGLVSLVSTIVGFFADGSYKDMDFLLRSSLPWLKSFQDTNNTIAEMLKNNPNDVAANALKARFAYLESEVRDSIQQRRFLTSPVSLNLGGTFGTIQPNPMVKYTKPVLLLINEFDFSGGDAFPALMKDNGRVTLFGTQTTGAGGNVREYGPLANSFFKMSLTESLMVRPNGDFVENRGIKPDIEYVVTEEDFMNGYQSYVRAFTIEALKLAGVSEEQFKAMEAEKAHAALGR